jgi:hypothetical protein
MKKGPQTAWSAGFPPQKTILRRNPHRGCIFWPFFNRKNAFFVRFFHMKIAKNERKMVFFEGFLLVLK